MKKLLAFLCLFVVTATVQAAELSEIVFGTTSKDDTLKIINDWTLLSGYMNPKTKRTLYKLLYNNAVKYCTEKKRQNCTVSLDLKELQQQDQENFLQNFLDVYNIQFTDLLTPQIFNALGSDKNINLYLHGIAKFYFDSQYYEVEVSTKQFTKSKKRPDFKFYKEFIKTLTAPVGGMQDDIINQKDLLKDDPSLKYNLFKTLLDKLVSFKQDLTEIIQYLDTSGLNDFAQYLKQQEIKRQQQQQIHDKPINELAQGLNDIK